MMAENNFTQLQDEEEVDPLTLDEMQLGIMSTVDSSRSFANIFEFLITKMKTVIVAILGGETKNQ